ncbi:MAG: DivIVA domain-containing protein [Clostridiales bacterium]|nr:DivIVA domain-containing protein [Clostridiales bacterium]
MITPEDIQKKEFGKSVRGYNQEEVDVFLDQLTADYESIIKDNENLSRQAEELRTQLEGYRETEGAVLKTLEAAKELMKDISASAEKRANILVKNAELDADLKQRQARDNVERLKEEEARLRLRVNSIKSKFRSFMESELERFDSLSEVIFGVADSSDEVLRKPRKAPAAEVIKRPVVSEVRDDDDDDLFKTIISVRGKE